MKLEEVLKRVGGEVASAEKTDSGFILMLRVDPELGGKWADTIREFLLNKATAWSTDVSKLFYASGGSVKYLWRIVLRGNTKAAAEALSAAALRALMQIGELDSYPLVGRREYEFDPANGKIAGPHAASAPARIIAATTLGRE